MTRRSLFASAVLFVGTLAPPCALAQPRKVGVLLANHGSRSAAWRGALLDLDRKVREPLLQSGHVHGVKTAFMEYTEPSVATRMREFDEEGFSDVIVMPVFLTVSAHTFDDIPTILGRKADPRSLQALKIEGIARYTPRARTHFAPRLDFGALVRENVLRRALKLSKDPSREAYETQWSALMREIAAYVRAETGIGPSSWGWAGHVAHYDPVHTTRAIEEVLARKERAVVVPVFVAFDEMFQVRIIGSGIAAVPRHRERVAYAPDAILPDPAIESWLVETVRGMAGDLAKKTVAETR
jgi:sirohydrochlorin ferrochelatase